MLSLVPHVGLTGESTDALRTEDVKFSPSGRVLAVVATNGSIYLFAVDTTSRPVRITRRTELQSASLASAHGIDFLSEEVVVVANRSGWVTFYRIPGVAAWPERAAVEPVHEMGSPWFGAKGATRDVKGRMVRCGPGSVRVRGQQLFVCCNNQSTVTTHPFALRQGRVETGEGTATVLEGLEIPDGIAVSRDGRWMAVSDHQNGRIAICDVATRTPSALLSDVDLHHPHGLCFDPTGRALYVADAGEPLVQVFVSADEWATSASRSTFKSRGVDAEAFRRTRESVAEEFRHLEGGIKGLDLDPAGRVLACTCQNQMLRFFEAEALPSAGAPVR